MVFSNFRSKHKWSFPVTPKQERSQKTSECRGIDDPGWIAENQSPQTVREDRTKNRYDPFVCFERAYESQFVHDEHDEKVHGKHVVFREADVRNDTIGSPARLYSFENDHTLKVSSACSLRCLIAHPHLNY